MLSPCRIDLSTRRCCWGPMKQYPPPPLSTFRLAPSPPPPNPTRIHPPALWHKIWKYCCHWELTLFPFSAIDRYIHGSSIMHDSTAPGLTCSSKGWESCMAQSEVYSLLKARLKHDRARPLRVLAFAPALRFLRSHILCRLDLQKSFGWGCKPRSLVSISMQEDYIRTLRSCSPCLSLVDCYANTKITQRALKVSRVFLCWSWTLYRRRRRNSSSNLVFYAQSTIAVISGRRRRRRRQQQQQKQH